MMEEKKHKNIYIIYIIGHDFKKTLIHRKKPFISINIVQRLTRKMIKNDILYTNIDKR